MDKLKILLPAPAVCLLLTACGGGDKDPPDLPEADRGLVADHAQTMPIPDAKAAQLHLRIRYHFAKKESSSSLGAAPSAEHFPDKTFRLNESGKTWYGLYEFDGDPEKDATFRAYYLNHPHDAGDKVLYIQTDYDNRTRRFMQEFVMSDGGRVFQEGTFEIVKDDIDAPYRVRGTQERKPARVPE
jgi:hypothetical protein